MNDPLLAGSEDTLPRPAGGGRRWALVLLKLVITFALLAFVLQQASWHKISMRISEASVLHLWLSLLPLVVVTMCAGMRWQIIASAIARKLRFSEAWIVSMIGSALDQMLVTLSGDAYRIWWLNRGSPTLVRAISGVLLDRVAGVLGITVLVIGFMPKLVALERIDNLLWVPIGLICAVLGGYFLVLIFDYLPEKYRNIRIFAALVALSQYARIVFLRPRLAIPVLIAAVLVHVGACVTISMLAWAIGINLPLLASLTLVPTVMLITLLPISIGGWGVREGVMVVALSLIGVEKSDAVLISVLFGLSSLSVGLFGGVLWLLGLPADTRSVISGSD